MTSPPSDVVIYRYRGKHLELTVPDIDFGRCVGGNLKSWIAPMDAAEEGDAFYGYTGPGYREEFWILDVDGTRLMIAAERSPGSPPEDLAGLRPSSTPSGSSRDAAQSWSLSTNVTAGQMDTARLAVWALNCGSHGGR